MIYKNAAGNVMKAALIGVLFAAVVPAGVSAQALRPANDLSDLLMKQPKVITPPPPGDYGKAPLEIKGDQGLPPAVASNKIVRRPETRFPERASTANVRSVVRLLGFDPTTKGAAELQTLRLDTLTAAQVAIVEGIFPQIAAQAGQPEIYVNNVTLDQMNQLNQALYPYPDTFASENQARLAAQQAQVHKGQLGWTPPQWVQVSMQLDAPAPGYPRETRSYQHYWIIPAVKQLSRFLVLIGVIAATIFLAIAAWGFIFGHREGSERVVSALSGLVLLLMAYTIWSVVMINANDGQKPNVLVTDQGATNMDNVRASDVIATNNSKAGGNYADPNLINGAILPRVPAEPISPPRSPQPVAPLSEENLNAPPQPYVVNPFTF